MCSTRTWTRLASSNTKRAFGARMHATDPAGFEPPQALVCLNSGPCRCLALPHITYELAFEPRIPPVWNSV